MDFPTALVTLAAEAAALLTADFALFSVASITDDVAEALSESGLTDGDDDSAFADE